MMRAIEPVGPEEIAKSFPDVLQRPAAEGARIVALHWLQELMEQRVQWRRAEHSGETAIEATTDARDSAEADINDASRTLHKARVALRRLRAVEREHRHELADAWSSRIDRSLRALGKATNAARDRDVQLAWLDAEGEGLAEDARAEAVTLRQLLLDEATSGFSRIESAFARHLDPIADKLGRRLSSYRREHRIGNGVIPEPRYADLVAARLEDGVHRLERHIQRLSDGHEELDASSPKLQERLHEIRILLKRHRAMLAPLTDMSPQLAALFEFETRGQDLLGAMRDADILALRAGAERLPALERALSDMRLSSLAAFADQWVDAQDVVREHFQRAVAALRDIARSKAEAVRDGTAQPAESTSGHGLPMEIERKFLLNDVPAEAIAMPPIVIEQGWIPGTKLRERLRRSTYPDGRVRCTRTIKLGRPEARIEIEEDTGNGIFQAMWALTSSARIRKRRHVVRDAAHVWEIDVFVDRDLVLAEVELDAENTPVNIPEWLAPYVVREVTGEAAYLNSQMARPDLGDSGTVVNEPVTVT